MVGTVLVTIKIMPESPSINLENLKLKISKIIENHSGKNPRYEEQPIAFGLNALMTFFTLKEDLPLDPIEVAINSLEETSSAQVTDMRRAVE